MKIHHVAITISNLEESKNFYSKVFGFKQIKAFERPDLKSKAIFLECDNTILELWEFSDVHTEVQNSNFKTIGIKHISFEVDSVDDFTSNLPNNIRASKIKKGASGAKYAFLKDPSGIDIEIYEPN